MIAIRRSFEIGFIVLVVTVLGIIGYFVANLNTFMGSDDLKINNNIVINYWTTPLYQNVVGSDAYGEWEQQKLAEFQQENPHVKINFRLIPSDAVEQQITVAALGNKLPDILLDGLDRRLMKYVQFGKSEDISDFIAGEMDDYTEMSLDIVSKDGKIYGVPTTITPIYMFINKTIFRNKGLEHLVPENREWTFDEWREAMRQVSGDGIYGTAIYAGNEQSDEMPLLYLFGNGVEIWNEESTEVVMDQYIEEAEEVIQTFKEMLAEDSLAPGASSLNSKDALDMFRQGKLSMLSWGQSIYNGIEYGKSTGSVKSDFELYGIKPVHKKGLTPKWALSLHGYTVFEQKDSEKREMVKKLIQFMTSEENTRLLAMSGGSIPARKSVAYDSLSSDGEAMIKILEGMPVANIGTNSSYYADVRSLWHGYFQAMLLDQMTVEEGIREFTGKANAIIEER